MKIIFKHKYDLTKPCVAKLRFGEKYLVLKAWDIKRSTRELIDAFKNDELPADGLKVYVIPGVRKAIREAAAGDNKCVVEIVLSSEKGAELLAREQAELNRKERGCLNKNKTVERPRWIFEYLAPAPPAAAGLFRIIGRHRQAPAIVKLWIGEKFFIWKCMDIQQFPDKFNESMAVNIERDIPEVSGALHPLVRYMVDHPQPGKIEVVYKGELTRAGVRKLLERERKLLTKFSRKSPCLNTSMRSYMPTWIYQFLKPKQKKNEKD